MKCADTALLRSQRNPRNIFLNVNALSVSLTSSCTLYSTYTVLCVRQDCQNAYVYWYRPYLIQAYLSYRMAIWQKYCQLVILPAGREIDEEKKCG